jgi:hypothetical protein
VRPTKDLAYQFRGRGRALAEQDLR